MISKDNTRIAITIPKELLAQLKDEAEYQGRSVSNLVSWIIKNYFKAKGKSK